MLFLQLLLAIAFLANVFSFQSSMRPRSTTFHSSTSLLRMSTEATPKLNPREERRRILKSENYNRMGFKDEKQGVEETMVKEFTSSLIAELRANKGVIVRGDVTVKLAEYYGFCWGVERAVSVISDKCFI